jgi:hypothetical protein
MPVHSRQPDFVASHMNLRQRVTNLETGVHPTLATVDYWDSFDPTPISYDSSTVIAPGSVIPKWSRRTGIVYLIGEIIGAELADIPVGGMVYGTLPGEARPKLDNQQLVGISISPFWTQVKIVASNGHLVVLPAISGSGNFTLTLDNVNYPFL